MGERRNGGTIAMVQQAVSDGLFLAFEAVSGKVPSVALVNEVWQFCKDRKCGRCDLMVRTHKETTDKCFRNKNNEHEVDLVFCSPCWEGASGIALCGSTRQGYYSLS